MHVHNLYVVQVFVALLALVAAANSALVYSGLHHPVAYAASPVISYAAPAVHYAAPAVTYAAAPAVHIKPEVVTYTAKAVPYEVTLTDNWSFRL